jgi:hypothetical protein
VHGTTGNAKALVKHAEGKINGYAKASRKYQENAQNQGVKYYDEMCKKYLIL